MPPHEDLNADCFSADRPRRFSPIFQPNFFSKRRFCVMDESRYYCFRNTHVLVGAKVIGYVGATLSAFFLFHALMNLNAEGVMISAMFVAVYGTLIIAQLKHKAKYYLPYLIVNGTALALNLIYVIFLGTMLVMMPLYWQRELDLAPTGAHKTDNGSIDDKKIYNVARATTGVIFVMMAIVEVLTVWFQSIVYRAYCYMNEDHTNLINPDVFMK